MSRTRFIYFLSAIVLIIGCFALNTSYSLFVDNDTTQLVETTVPTITESVTLSLPSVEVEGTKDYLIKQTITNNNSIPIGFRLTASSDSTTYQVQSTKYVTETEPEEVADYYYSYGTIEANTTKDIYLRVSNTNEDTSNIATINFSLESDYATLKMNTDEYLARANIDNESQYEITITSGSAPYSNNTNTLAYKLIEKQITKFGSTIEIDKTNSNLDDIFKTSNKISLPISIPGELNVTELTEVTDIETNDVGLYKAEDDYGISYYYRGAIDYNYVNFAGMCWRIVRIEGDGTIKLILEDSLYECNDTRFSGSWHWNYESDSCHFGELTNNGLNFLNYVESDGLLSSFLKFQNNKLSATDLEYLKIEEWCYDDSISDESTYCDEFCYNDIEYGAAYRIYFNKPSLICDGTIFSQFNNSNMFVGTLTLDEIIFAGGFVDYNQTQAANYDYYLMNYDYISYSWWTLTPLNYSGYLDRYYVNYLSSNGYIFREVISTGSSYSLESRPVVTLKHGTLVTGDGTGTKDNPYLIG